MPTRTIRTSTASSRTLVTAAVLLAAGVAVPAPSAQAAALPDLVVAVSDAPDPAVAGRSLTYTLTVTNRLSTTATGVRLVVPLPAGVTYRSATATHGTCTFKRHTVTCRLSKVSDQDDAVVTVDVTVTTAGILTTTAEVSSSETDAVPADNIATADTKVSSADCGQAVLGDIVLDKDVGPCAGDGVVIRADGVTVDLGGHRIFGFPGPSSETCAGVDPAECGNEAGVRLPMRTGVTVKNGRVSDFDAGVLLNGGGANIVTGLTIQDNTGPGDTAAFLGDGIVLFNSAGNRITGNTLSGNGVYDGIGVLGPDSDGNSIEDNVVHDTRGPAAGAPFGQGIIVNAALDVACQGQITGTSILRNVVVANASAGITNLNNVDGTISDNVVERNGERSGGGNGIGVRLCQEATDVSSRLLIQRNRIHYNAGSGLEIGPLATGNRILDNDAAENATANTNLIGTPDDRGFRDLTEMNQSCAGNTWYGNDWGGGYYSRLCVTAGGTGPPSPEPVVDPTPDDPKEIDVLDLIRHPPRV